MFDPGAMGTLIIGLESIRRQDAADARGVLPISRLSRRSRPVRHGIATILRRAASLVDPVPVPAADRRIASRT
jgi:hypothetical protein